MKKKRIGKIVYGIFALLMVAGLVYGGCRLGLYFHESRTAAEQYAQLAERLEQIREELPQDQPPSEQPTDGTQDDPQEPEGAGILPDYQPLYEMNPDMVGWISVPNTIINYPVMQTPDDPDYYLSHDFYKQKSEWGVIYAREVSDVNSPSDNVTLYGHYKRDGTMFSRLDHFKKKSYWQDNQTFTFDTLYERHTYRVWAVFKTSANYGEGYGYHLFSDAKDQQEFDTFVDTVKSLAFYDTGITPVYGDKLLTLSTCEYTLSNGRFVVCAVRVS